MKIGSFILDLSKTECLCSQRRVGETEQAFGTGAAFGLPGIAPEENCYSTLQPALDHAQPAAQALFLFITCRSSCNKLKNSRSFWRGNGHDLNGPDDCDGIGLWTVVETTTGCGVEVVSPTGRSPICTKIQS